MPMKPMEMEKIILADGWVFKSQEGSSQRYRKFHQKTGGA